MGLQGVEMVLLGYNTPASTPENSEEGPEAGVLHIACR